MDPEKRNKVVEWSVNRLSEAVLRITGEEDVRTGAERILRYGLDAEFLAQGNGPDWVPPEGEGRPRSTREAFMMEIAVFCVYFQVADPRLINHLFGLADEHSFRSGVLFGEVDTPAIYLMAIDAYQDDRARDILLEYLLQPGLPPGHSYVYGTTCPRGDWPLWFLRGYDAEGLRLRIEAALRERERNVPEPWRYVSIWDVAHPGDLPLETREAIGECDALRLLIGSLNYAASLRSEDRKAYQYYERSYSHAEAVVPHRSAIHFRTKPDWQIGNEPFVVFLSDIAKSSSTLGWVEHPHNNIPPESIERFKQILEEQRLSDTARKNIQLLIAPE
jgi:hypothetical protein